MLFQGAVVPCLRYRNPGLHHEQNIFKMGGLRKALPVSFLFSDWQPGFDRFSLHLRLFSKDEILLGALELEGAGFWFWLGGVVGAFFTGIYTFRLFFIVFFGDSHAEHPPGKEVGGWHMNGPLIPLMTLALAGGLSTFPWTMCSAMGSS